VAASLIAAISDPGVWATIREEDGQSQLEYELLIGFLIVVALVTLTRFGAQVHALANTITSAL
jgi:Flp pilus assembly pilin Flp